MSLPRVFAIAGLAGLSLMAWGKPKKPAAAETISHVRIVRLSLVSGPVQVKFPGRAWQRGLINAPVTEGETVRTGANARAEVELEDGSTIRLIPNSSAGFTELALLNRVRLTTVRPISGTIYLNLRRKHTTRGFRLRLPEGLITLPFGKSEFRVMMSGSSADVLVLDGHLNLVSGGLPYKLNKNDQLTLVAGEPASLANDHVRDRWDAWNHQRNQIVEVNSLSGLNSPFSFGLAELGTYGTWDNDCWQPLGMAAGWSPYNNGIWYYDPSVGYVWDSFYPWGWLPFHFGAWMMGTAGWCWTPSNDFWSFAPMPTAFYVPGGPTFTPPRRPPPPPPPPVRKKIITANATVHGGAAVRGAHPIRGLIARRSRPAIPTRAQISHMTRAQRSAWNRAISTARYWSWREQNYGRPGEGSSNRSGSGNAGYPGSMNASESGNVPVSGGMLSSPPVSRVGGGGPAGGGGHIGGGSRIPH